MKVRTKVVQLDRALFHALNEANGHLHNGQVALCILRQWSPSTDSKCARAANALRPRAVNASSHCATMLKWRVTRLEIMVVEHWLMLFIYENSKLHFQLPHSAYVESFSSRLRLQGEGVLATL